MSRKTWRPPCPRAAPGSGIVTVFVVGSTAGMTTIEFEDGAIADLNGVFERLAPRERRLSSSPAMGR